MEKGAKLERSSSLNVENQNGTRITVALTLRYWYSPQVDTRKADREKIHVASIWSEWFHSERRQVVCRSVLEGCRGPRKEAPSARENLPDFRSRQPLCIR